MSLREQKTTAKSDVLVSRRFEMVSQQIFDSRLSGGRPVLEWYAWTSVTNLDDIVTKSIVIWDLNNEMKTSDDEYLYYVKLLRKKGVEI